MILTRPAVEAGERLGFLPGDLMAKIDPYLRPLFDALHDMLEPEKVAAYLERGQIEVAPLAFMRGRTLNDSFMILDEAQNTTPEQMKMFLTRLGFNSKMVITGDITQIDLPQRRAVGARRRRRDPRGHRGHRVRALRRRGRRAPPPRAADRRGLRRARRAPDARAAPGRSRPGVTRARGRLESRSSAASCAAAAGRRSSGCVALALASAAIDEGHVAVEFVDADADRRAQRARIAARTGRPMSCRSPSTSDERSPPARASSATS